jgi:hypothetical protein
MNFIRTMPSPCARALVLMANLCLVVNCHKPGPQLGNKDAVVTNANTGNSNSTQNSQAVTVQAPASNQTTKPTTSPTRPSVSATPKPREEFASRENDDKKANAQETDAYIELERDRAVRDAERVRRVRRVSPARPKQSATP